MRRVGNALTRRKGVGVFGSALLRREGVRGFGFGIGCSGVIQMTRDGRRQVRIGRIGVGTVTVVTGMHFTYLFLHHLLTVLAWAHTALYLGEYISRLCLTLAVAELGHILPFI